MDYFLNATNKINEYRELVTAIREGTPCGVTGISAIHKSLFLASLLELKKNILVIVEDESNAVKMCDDINTFCGSEKSAVFPVKDLQLLSDMTASEEYNQKRLDALAKLCEKKVQIIVASAEAVMQMTVEKSVFINKKIKITDGTLNREELISNLISNGYTRISQVEGKGQFAIRGDIIDIFAIGENEPIRIELWGDEIDTISYFDLESQRRTKQIKKISIYPAKEVLFESKDAEIEAIKNAVSKIRSKNADAIKENIYKDIEKIENGLFSASSDKYIALAYGKETTIFDFFNDELSIMCESATVKDRAVSATKQHAEDIEILLENSTIFKGIAKYMLTYEQMMARFMGLNHCYFDLFLTSSVERDIKKLIDVIAMQNSSWGGELKLLKDELSDYRKHGYNVLIFAGTQKSAKTLASDLTDEITQAVYIDKPKDINIPVQVTSGFLSGGFELPKEKIAVITSAKTSKVNKKTVKVKRKKGEEISSLSELTEGDFVVHTTHGIGKYDGIEQLTVGGVIKDYIKIKYAGTDVLYVPVTQLDLVSRYIGVKEDGAVKLNKLNSVEWNKTRTRVRAAVKEMAEELTKLYAQRQNAKGYAFSPDNEWQREFEARFPYDETDDQLQSILEIKHDMQKPTPMDRLLCGDVGFGKTEVALRAAFKCVLDSKQVCILVPTTVLALQHYQTIMKRLGDFPVNVELLSRFRTPKQQKQIKNRLKDGTLDIVVGTHSLLQKDIEFASLGLLIIDEEQRFGVAHKEKLKEKFIGVDVLSLSATPIPRTLNMAMSGIRDMSVINEAPQDRHPVQTYVIEYDKGIIRQALEKELRRGGQVYYIHNRIDTIDLCAKTISELVPNARIGTAHGRMSEEQLSEVWRQLLEHEIDILVCTTLIETGVDVPNCNTLIIENADRFGLSQLYQLRGRVGRNDRRAYAYFTFVRGKALSEVASKRLEAIREFTQFGSGFRIAMRDLEIRGAGSILGAHQHGHMESVGYDMYLRLLAEEIAKQKGEPLPPAPDECLVDIVINAHIPDKYIENELQRIEVYRRLAAIRTREDALDITDELIDRYGEPPQAVSGLIEVALLRNMAAGLGVTEILQKGKSIRFVIKSEVLPLVGALYEYYKDRFFVSTIDKSYIDVDLKGEDSLSVMKNVLTILDTAKKEDKKS